MLKNNVTQGSPSKKRDWFFYFGIVGFIFSIIVCAISGETILSSFSMWYQFIIPIPALIAGQGSGITNFARVRDLNADEKNTTYELWGTSLGIMIGLAVGIGIAVQTLHVLTGGVFIHLLGAFTVVFNFVGSMGSVGNRLGTCIKKPNGATWREKILSLFNWEKNKIALASLLGLAGGLALWFTGSATLISILGVTTFFTGGAAIPIAIAGAIFVLSVTSSSASSANYFIKAFTFIKAAYKNDAAAKASIEGKIYEFKGSTLGIAIGLIVATTLVVALFITQPYLIAAVIPVIAIYISCTGLFGGMFSRFGRILLDNFISSTPAPVPILIPEEKNDLTIDSLQNQPVLSVEDPPKSLVPDDIPIIQAIEPEPAKPERTLSSSAATLVILTRQVSITPESQLEESATPPPHQSTPSPKPEIGNSPLSNLKHLGIYTEKIESPPAEVTDIQDCFLPEITAC